MEHPVHAIASAGGAGFIRSPLGIAVLMIISTAGGGWIKDRLDTAAMDTAATVRIEALSARLTALESSEMPASQFRDYEKATDQRLDDIKDLVKEINHNLSLYGPPPPARR